MVLLSSEDQCPPILEKTGKTWGPLDKGSTESTLCPLNFCENCPLAADMKVATRYCNESAHWEKANYTLCYTIMEEHPDCIGTVCNPCPLPVFKDLVQTVTLTLTGLSIFCLLVSLLIFCSFKFILMFVWIMAWRYKLLSGCGPFTKEAMEPFCKALLFLIMYTTMASINWMFVEGVYLASRISIFVFNTGTPIAPFCFIGWGLPLFWVSAWAILMENSNGDRMCWLPYSNSSHKWLLIIPMLITLVLNLFLLVLIIAILVQKLTATNVEEPKKLWKATKATLILVPLLGVANLLWFVEPTERESNAYRAYILFNTTVQHSQGIFIAFIYCFLNGEVRQLLGKCLRSCNLSRRERRRRRQQLSQLTESSSRSRAGSFLSTQMFNTKSLMSDDCPI